MNYLDRAEQYKKNPIYGTNLNRPMSEVVHEIRMKMDHLRGQVQDFKFGFPGWKDRVEHVEGLLTCGIVALYNVVKEFEKFEKERNDSR